MKRTCLKTNTNSVEQYTSELHPYEITIQAKRFERQVESILCMKTQIFVIVLISLLFCSVSYAQTNINILDQNISIIAEDEPLTEVIRKICDEFHLDFEYNSKLIQGKRINLSVTNKTLKEVLDNLMKDFYLIFEIDNNVLVVRDYVPMSEHIDFDALYNSPSTGFLFDNPKKKSITIDFKLISNLIVIPVSINGSDTMNFILDTGVKDPIITELTLVSELNLNYMKPIELRGLGSDMVTQAYQSGDNTMKIPGLTLSHQLINVVIDENFQISQILGIPVHGLIGFNLFRHYIVKIDYLAQQIKLYKPQFFTYKPRKNDIVLPVFFVRNKPIVRSEVVQDSITVPVLLLIDTGASDALWLSPTSNEKIKISDNSIYSYLGMGLGGDLFGYKARTNGLWLGGKVLVNPIVSYPESDFIDQIMIGEKRNGTIGGEILRRFTLYFDYYHNRIILRPNNDFNDEFDYNKSGLEIINPVPGVPVFTINNVMENSPAWNAGLRKNDQILSVNHVNHHTISLNDINLMLRQRDNKKIKMEILRNGVEMKIEFRLKDSI